MLPFGADRHVMVDLGRYRTMDVAGGDDAGVLSAISIAPDKGLASHAQITGDSRAIRAGMAADLLDRITLPPADTCVDCAAMAAPRPARWSSAHRSRFC
ncbi:MAG: hypothetical protein R3F54_15215 [Alphaproteobacteria bacterium]